MGWVRRFLERYAEDRRFRFLLALGWGVSVLIVGAIILR